MNVTVKNVNFVRSPTEFQTFLNETEVEYRDVIFFKIKWLAGVKMLKRVFNPRERIGAFMAHKGKLVPLFSDH